MRNLFSAIEKNRDYTVVELLKRDDDKVECLVVDVQTDGFPPKNQGGIKCRERLALCVSDNPKLLVEVFGLRRDFPILMHQNQSPSNGPRSLCLYFEPPASVLRTWTAEKFLRRIQWWLEGSARGDLHAADQPVEQLFFETKYELVLPWNYEQIRQCKDHQLVIRRGSERPNGSVTCFVEGVLKDRQMPRGTIQHIEFALPAIVHGPIEQAPSTLGELSDMLLSRGVDLFPSLKTALSEGIDTAGLPETPDNTVTMILIHIPIARTVGGEPELTMHRAFLIPLGTKRLGVATGILDLVEVPEGNRFVRKYFRTVIIGSEPTDEWRSQEIFPVEVLLENDSAAARKQSGIADEGPVGAFIGAGALGSAVLNLWGRGGWGQWTVIDKDHIRPHNLSRHTAFAQHIGESKVNVVAELHSAITRGASQITPLHTDACDLTQPLILNVLRDSKLVVDASTTLEYPRVASELQGLARHVSIFVTPNGNDAVLLVEDKDRKIRLRSLEAQYYRAVIRETWGQHHLDGNLSTFWSGATCRDITAVMPYSRIQGHASTIAEQIPKVAADNSARIRIWQRDPNLGSVVAHEIEPSEEISAPFGSFRLVLDVGLLRQLREWRGARLPNETGGVLLGYHDFNVNTLTIVAAFPAPADSVSSPIGFERGVKDLPETVREASRRTAEIVGYVGEWHSHPKGHSASPSSDDLLQLVRLARGMAADGLPAVQLIVGEKDFQALQMTSTK
ncbi:MAG: Mov34/MPN/PAD-1 family protein [Nitrospira sp.]|nr:Mov34/MPN/PAD-1 family protein [Nitrospira sp.]